jgi:hypothetical protein
MAITPRTPQTPTENASTQSISPALPADIEAGDCAVVWAVVPGTSTGQLTPPSGWTELFAPFTVADNNIVGAWYRFDPPGAPTITTSASASRATGIVDAYGGVNPTVPLDVTPSTAVTSPYGTSITPAALTTVTDGCMLISGAILDSSSAAFTATPSGMTVVADATGGSVGRGSAYARQAQASAGGTGTTTWTAGSSLGMGGFLAALRPLLTADKEDATSDEVTFAETEDAPTPIAFPVDATSDEVTFAETEDAPTVANYVTGAGLLVSGIPVTAGQEYTASIWARVSVANVLRVQLEWLDGGASLLETTDGTDTAAAAGEWTWLHTTGTAPASTATLRVRVEAGESSEPFLTGQTLDGDGLLVAVGPTAWTLTGGPSQGLTVERAANDVVKSHPAGTALSLAEPWYWVARPPGGGDYLLPPNAPPPTPPVTPPDTGGGTTTPATPTTVQIGASTYPLAAVNPTGETNPAGAAYRGARGTDQLVIYQAPVTVTETNQWGIEVTVDGGGIVTAVSDRQADQNLTGTDVPDDLDGGYVLSGHGLARDWLLQYAVEGATVVLLATTGGGSTGGGTTSGGSTGGGTSVARRSTLPWDLGVFGNETGTAASGKVDAFAAMAGVALDVVDAHPDFDDFHTSDWWHAPHAGRGYNICASTSLYKDDISANNTSRFTAAATALRDAGWSAPWWRIGIEFNLNNETRATDSNYTTWISKYQTAVNAVRAVTPNAKFILCMNEGNSQSCSNSTTDAIVNALCASGHVTHIGPDYYDQWEPIRTTSEAVARFGTASTHGKMNYWLARAKALGVKMAVPEWGVSSGTQWAGHTGGDNPFYVNYFMDWCYANRDTVEAIFYFEEPAGYLRSDITTTATNPQARAAFRNKVTQYKGATASGAGGGTTSSGGSGGGVIGGGYPATNVAVYRKIWSSDGDIATAPANATELRLSFAQGDPPTLGGYGSTGQAAFVANLAQRRQAGQRIIVSVGGAGGSVNVGNRTAFVNGIKAIHNTLASVSGGGLDGLDWDIEAGSSFPTSDAIAVSLTLKQDLGSQFAIVMAPNGVNKTTYRPAAAQMHIAGCLDWIGQQYYDAPVSLSVAMSNIQEYINAGIPASKMGVGMMMPPSGASDRHWTLAQCQTNMAAIKSQYGIRRCYLWTENHQQAAAAQWVAAMRSIVGI